MKRWIYVAIGQKKTTVRQYYLQQSLCTIKISKMQQERFRQLQRVQNQTKYVNVSVFAHVYQMLPMDGVCLRLKRHIGEKYRKAALNHSRAAVDRFIGHSEIRVVLVLV